MTSSDYSDNDEQSFVASINHPSFIRTRDSPAGSYLSSPSPSLDVVESSRRSSQVSGINHPSFSHKPSSQQSGETNETSSVWSFHYSDFEQELLQDTSLPHSLRSKVSSSPRSVLRQSPLNFDDSSPLLLDNYPSDTQQRLERSFVKQFDLQPSPSSHHSVIVEGLSNDNSGISQRHMMDMMESKVLQMQESLSNRIQLLEDKFQSTHLDRSGHSSSGSALSKELERSYTSQGDEGGSISSQNRQQRSTTYSNDKKSIDQSTQTDQHILDLQQFVDRVDSLVWNTPWMSPMETINTAHVCDRHRAWSEQIIQERQKATLNRLDEQHLPYSKERLDATMDRLLQWSESLRKSNR